MSANNLIIDNILLIHRDTSNTGRHRNNRMNELLDVFLLVALLLNFNINLPLASTSNNIQKLHLIVWNNFVCILVERYGRTLIEKYNLKQVNSWIFTCCADYHSILFSSKLIACYEYQTPSWITCKHGSAEHCVKGDHNFLWNIRFWGTCQTETSQPINENLHDWLRRWVYLMCRKWLESVRWGRHQR